MRIYGFEWYHGRRLSDLRRNKNSDNYYFTITDMNKFRKFILRLIHHYDFQSHYPPFGETGCLSLTKNQIEISISNWETGVVENYSDFRKLVVVDIRKEKLQDICI